MSMFCRPLNYLVEQARGVVVNNPCHMQVWQGLFTLSVLDQTCTNWRKFVFFPLHEDLGWSHSYSAIICVNSAFNKHIYGSVIYERDDALWTVFPIDKEPLFCSTPCPAGILPMPLECPHVVILHFVADFYVLYLLFKLFLCHATYFESPSSKQILGVYPQI